MKLGCGTIAEYSDTYTIVFIYDAAGSPIGMRYRSASFASEVWETYWYEKNLQGDIVAIYSNDGVKLISYIYDAWSSFTTTYHNGGASTTAAKIRSNTVATTMTPILGCTICKVDIMIPLPVDL